MPPRRRAVLRHRPDRPKITRAIAGISEDSWTPIKYPHAIFDEDEQRWIFDAQVAEVTYTAFAGKKKHEVTARLIMRRVRRLAPPRQGELLPTWRHHAILTDSPLQMLADQTDHRDHAITEALIVGHFAANAARLTCAAISHKPAPRRRHAGLPTPRPRPQLHPPPLPDHHPDPARAPRTRPADPAPTPRLALAARLSGLFDTTHRAPPARAA